MHSENDMKTDDIPIMFQAAKIQKSFELYWKAMKSLNEDFKESDIETFFTSALMSAEACGYIKL